jgi:hypothetical protein
MATDLALAMQISANTTQLASAARDVSAKLQGMAQAGRKASADLAVLKTIEISRVFVSSITAATRSLSAIVSGSAAAIAGVDDLSNRTGVSVQSLQAYQFAAEQSGVSVETAMAAAKRSGVRPRAICNKRITQSNHK